MENLIPVVNKLQDVFGAIGQQPIDLPQIVVVGSQSAGKSSVLENVVGRDFLPRGFGIVTRRPLVLQLYSLIPDDDAEETSKGEEWGEFLHLPGQRFFDFDEIRNEIQRETDRVTGRNKGISNKTINLKIYSPYVLNLTLVDLPGITKVPTGDQPEDVEEQIRAMCYEFISNPNAVILAVTAANQDLANSDGLKMARSVDPDGERTIGVLTKVDIMDHGTDCADVLNNKVIPLRRGHIAIVNRSQKDVQDGVPIRKGLAKEANFFQSHPKYRTMLEKCGTPNLSRTLNQILLHHIRDCLPEIKSRIGKMLSSVQMNLDSLGESIDEQSAQYKGGIILRMMSKFAENFGNKVDGKSSTELSTEMTELYGGARINYIFNEIFGKLLRSVDPFDGLEDEDIRTAIANANGTRPSLFVPEISFDLLVRRQIARLEQPGLHCVELILEEMQTMVRQSETLELARFPDLKDRALEIVDKLLRDCVSPAQKMISNLIQIELAYINTSHPDFIGGKQAAANAAAQARKQPPPAPMQQQQQQLNNSDGSHRTGSIDLTNAESSAKQQQLMSPAAPMAPSNGASSQEGRGFFGLFQAPTGGGGSNNNSAKAMGNNVQSSALVGPASKQHFHSGGGGGGGGGSSSGGGGYRGDDLKIIRLPQVPEKMRCTTAFSDKDRMEIEIIKNLIGSYFDIVKKNFTDLVPKSIMHFLVVNFKQSMQNELVSQLYREQVMDDLMKEAPDIATKRKAYSEMRDLLFRANEIVNEVRDFQPIK